VTPTDVERFQAAVLAADDVATRVLELGTLEHGDGYVVRRSERFPIPAANCLFAYGEDEDPAVEALPGLRDRFAAEGLPFGVETRVGASPRVDAAAAALGLTQEESQVGMLVDADDLAKVDVGALTITELRRMEDWAPWAALMGAGFGAPPELFLGIAEQRLLEPPASGIVTAFLAYDADGSFVASATASLAGEAVNVANVVTAPRHRGRGYGSAVTTWASRWGFRHGAAFAYLHASEMGLEIYRRLGFREVAVYVVRTAPVEG
jgi:GNAT superfamily N-acetyltransferase